jgi:hypothetical protein
MINHRSPEGNAANEKCSMRDSAENARRGDVTFIALGLTLSGFCRKRKIQDVTSFSRKAPA